MQKQPAGKKNNNKKLQPKLYILWFFAISLSCVMPLHASTWGGKSQEPVKSCRKAVYIYGPVKIWIWKGEHGVHLQRINGIFICIHVQLPFCEWDQHDKMNMQESTYSLLLTFFCDVSGCYTVLIWFPCFFTLIRGDFLTHIVAGGTWPEPRFD